MSKKDSLTLVRTGKFGFITVGDKHCGMAPAGTRQECDYVVRVKCDPDTLDDKDFMFEQLVVQQYFDRIKRVRSSCEHLVMRIASELEDVILEENPDLEIYWIEVQVKAAPYAASMTFRYHP
jgi:hypothetical protein